MPREVFALRRLAPAGLAVLALVCATPLHAQGTQATLTATVPAGVHKTLRLRSLPKDAQIAVVIQATGRIKVVMLTEADFQRYPNPEDPVFVAPVERKLSIALTMPETGNYYVVFDNTKGTEERKVQMLIRAARGTAAPAKPSQPPGSMVPQSPPRPLQQKPQEHDM
jgi:hypothetical protein